MSEPACPGLLAHVGSILQAHDSCAPHTALDAAALLVHASALAHGYDGPGPVSGWCSDRDRHAWSYSAPSRTVHVVLTRIAKRIAILASVEESTEQGACALLDVVLSKYIDATALPWRASDPAGQLMSLYHSAERVQAWEQLLEEHVWGPISSPSGPVQDTPLPYRPRAGAPTLAEAPRSPSAFPLCMGDADRDPWAASPDVLGGVPLARRPPRGDGMIVGPDHPIWQGPHRERRPYDPDGQPLPPMAAPPGARFDPIGPFPPLQRRGDPDWDEFAPPSMFS